MLDWLRSRPSRRATSCCCAATCRCTASRAPFIYDANASELGRSIDRLNYWLSTAAGLAAHARRDEGARRGRSRSLLLVLALLALPVRRGPRIDGAWLRFGRPRAPRRTARADRRRPSRQRARTSSSRASCAIRSRRLLAERDRQARSRSTRSPKPSWSPSCRRPRGTPAGVALARVYRACARCRAAVRPPHRGARATSRDANSTRCTKTSPSCVVLLAASYPH